MKALKIIAILLGAYVALVVVFESLLGYFQPANEDTMVIVTTDAEGARHERVLTPVENDGQLYAAANHWPRAWYEQAKARPDVQVTINGETGSYRAVPVTGAEHEAVNSARPLGPVIRFLTGFPPRYFLRLEPVG